MELPSDTQLSFTIFSQYSKGPTIKSEKDAIRELKPYRGGKGAGKSYTSLEEQKQQFNNSRV